MISARDSREKALVLRYFELWNALQPVGPYFPDFTIIHHSRPEIRDEPSLMSVIGEARARDPELHVLVDAILGDAPLFGVVGRVHDTADGEARLRSFDWTFRVSAGSIEIWRY